MTNQLILRTFSIPNAEALMESPDKIEKHYELYWAILITFVYAEVHVIIKIY